MRATYRTEEAALAAAERHGWTLGEDTFGPTAITPAGTSVSLLASAPPFHDNRRFHWVDEGLDRAV